MSYQDSVLYTPKDGRNAWEFLNIPRRSTLDAPLWSIAVDMHYGMQQKLFVCNALLDSSNTVTGLVLCDEHGWSVGKLSVGNGSSAGKYLFHTATDPLSSTYSYKPKVKTTNAKYFRSQLAKGQRARAEMATGYSEFRKYIQEKLSENENIPVNMVNIIRVRYTNKFPRVIQEAYCVSPALALSLLSAYQRQSFSGLIDKDAALQKAYQTYEKTIKETEVYKQNLTSTLGGERWLIVIGQTGVSVSAVQCPTGDEVNKAFRYIEDIPVTFPTRLYCSTKHLAEDMPADDYKSLVGALTMARLYRESKVTDPKYCDSETKLLPKIDQNSTEIYPDASLIYIADTYSTMISVPKF